MRQRPRSLTSCVGGRGVSDANGFTDPWPDVDVLDNGGHRGVLRDQGGGDGDPHGGRVCAEHDLADGPLHDRGGGDGDVNVFTNPGGRGALQVDPRGRDALRINPRGRGALRFYDGGRGGVTDHDRGPT